MKGCDKMKDYKENGSVIEITLDNEKVVKVSTKYIDNMVDKLGIDKEDAILTWLEDEEYLVNEEQEELVQKSKDNKVKMVAKSEKPKAKTPKERVQKENPTKELIISTIAKALENLDISNLNIENKAKLITFTLGNEDFKVDLVQKRKPKDK